MIGLLRSLGATLLDALQLRLSLWANDWAAELQRVASLLYWLWLSVFFLMLASVLLLVAAWLAFEQHRLGVMLGLGGVALVLWGISHWQWQRITHKPHPPWAATLEQLRRDRERL